MVKERANHTLAQAYGTIKKRMFQRPWLSLEKNEVLGAQSSGSHGEAQVSGSNLKPDYSSHQGLVFQANTQVGEERVGIEQLLLE